MIGETVATLSHLIALIFSPYPLINSCSVSKFM